MKVSLHLKNRENLTDAFLIVLSIWIGSYAYYQIFLNYELKPLYTYILVILFTGYWVVVHEVEKTAVISSIDRGFKNIFTWFYLYLLWLLVTYYYSSQSDIASEALIRILESLALLACFLVLVNHPTRIHKLSAVFSILAVVGAILCILDFIEPTFSIVPGRGAGFYENPTIAGRAINYFMVCGVMIIPKRIRWAYIVFCGLGVLVTFTRSSWLLWGVAVIGLNILGYLGGIRLRMLSISFIAALIVFIILALFTGATENIINDLGLQQFMTQNTLQRLSIGNALLEDYSAAERINIAKYSIDMIERAPILGYGVGFTNEWAMRVAPHNMLLQQWVDGGLILVSLYLGLLVIMWKTAKGTGKILVVLFFLDSFFTHNNFDQPFISLLIAFTIGTRLIFIHPRRVRLIDAYNSRKYLSISGV